MLGLERGIEGSRATHQTVQHYYESLNRGVRNQVSISPEAPGKPAVEKKIGTKLEDLQAEVGGLIECIYCHRDGTLIVANDEAKLLGMEGNRRLDGGSVIAGPFFVVGDAGENFRSLTDAEVNRYLQVYAEPQQISQREVRADMGMTFYRF